jgi:hypothetical protein
MIVILHVLIAAVSIAHVTLAYFRPSRKQIYISYSFVGLTLLSGVSLVVFEPARMIQACTSGLVYLAVMTVAIMATNVKLARTKINSAN